MPVNLEPHRASPPAKHARRRLLPVGADVQPDGGVDFRVWAPRRRRVDVVLDPDAQGRGAALPLEPEADGYFAGFSADAAAGTRYAFRLDDGERLYPDPASRFQPDGPHGPSQVVDPTAYRWSDDAWQGVAPQGQVIYELHAGTFTSEGTWAAAARELDMLAELGITIIEIMPIADFPGRFGWGYDGVDYFAPTRLYGTPDDLRRFVDEAHRHGIGVILDVVYNHLGPDGNYLREFSSDYISTRHVSEWGDSPNFDGPNNGPVRELVIANAGYWIDEFHFDGLRLDATQQVCDDSDENIMAAITRAVEQRAGKRSGYVVAENEPQDVKLLGGRDAGGYGITALWNDDFHHSAKVALTGRTEAYYTDYRGSPQEFVSMVLHGFLYQGQWYSWQQGRRGSWCRGIASHRFVVYLENHDQVANSARGRRGHLESHPARFRALTALMLLGPQTPMLFQGQEYGAAQPFLYFADHAGTLGEQIRRGRGEFLTQFPSLASPDAQRVLDDPADLATFERCKLRPADRRARGPSWDLHADLLRLRRAARAIASPASVDAALLGDDCFVVRFGGDGDDERLLVVNLGRQLQPCPFNEPLVAPLPGREWALEWTSEDPRYGGEGSPEPRANEWLIPGNCAWVLRPRARTPDDDIRRVRTAPTHRPA